MATLPHHTTSIKLNMQTGMKFNFGIGSLDFSFLSGRIIICLCLGHIIITEFLPLHWLICQFLKLPILLISQFVGLFIKDL
jgi:hypothetical protein